MHQIPPQRERNVSHRVRFVCRQFCSCQNVQMGRLGGLTCGWATTGPVSRLSPPRLASFGGKGAAPATQAEVYAITTKDVTG
jgi:hypothetical protein